MKAALLATTLAAFGAILVWADPANAQAPTAAKAKAVAGSFACPIYPVYTDEAGSLYYCDYFENEMCLNASVTYHFGSLEWPYQMCLDNCEPALVVDKENTPFPGIEPVSPEYMHTFPEGAANPCKLNPLRKRHYLHVKYVEENELKSYCAKLQDYEFDPQAIGKQGDRSRRFIAFELKGNPPAGCVVTQVEATTTPGNVGDLVHVCEADLPNGETVPVVILRAKRAD